MKSLRQLFTGILIALASIGLLLGGFSLSFAEGNRMATSTATPPATPTPVPTLMPSSSPTWQPITPTLSTTLSTTPSVDSPTPFPSWTPTLTFTPPPPPVNCPPRPGWLIYFVQPGETLGAIAARYGISAAELQSANCMLTQDLLPGVVIYVPPIRTQTPLPCGAPNGWIAYSVQPGDTLYRLGVTYGTSVAELQRANCLGSSTLLHTGQTLYIPDTPPLPASPTAAVLQIMPTDTPLAAPTQDLTSMPTDTLLPAPSDTPAEVATASSIPATP